MSMVEAESEEVHREAGWASQGSPGSPKKNKLEACCNNNAMAAEDNSVRQGGGGGHGSDSYVAVGDKNTSNMSMKQRCHSRESSGTSGVRFVISDTTIRSSGGDDDEDADARVVILSPSPITVDEEAETLHGLAGTEMEDKRRVNETQKSRGRVARASDENGNDRECNFSGGSTPLKAVITATTETPRVDATECLLAAHDLQDNGIAAGSDCASSSLLGVGSDSCSSDDEIGANSSGYMRHKPRKRQHGSAQLEGVNVYEEGGGANANEQGNEHLKGEVPKEPLKTLAALLFFLLGAVATTTSLALAHEHVPSGEPLPDMFLDNVQYQKWGLDVSEVIIMVASIATFTLCLFHGSRFVVLRRVFFLGGLHYLYRAITMYVTVLPKPDTSYTCVPKVPNLSFVLVAQRVVKLLSGVGLSINGEHVYCGDYIYSGHTMTLVMTYLIVKEYSPRQWYLVHWLSWSVSAFGITVLLLARGHYSIDVIIAYWITTRLWWIYHTMANNPNLIASENSHNFLNRFWWWPIFQYLEGGVARPLPHLYNWPLPKPMVSRARRSWRRLTVNVRRQFHPESDCIGEPALAEQQQP